jgi:hypothetical protein|nr:MAG TPA: hypothetical protein [Caudoviricetes sp.]
MNITDKEFVSDIKAIVTKFRRGKLSKVQATDCILSEMYVYLRSL